MKKFLIIAIILFSSLNLFGKDSNVPISTYEPRFIVDMPTAGVLPVHTFSIYGQIFTNGGLLFAFDMTPFKNFNIGISYSGSNLLGDGNIIMQKYPGFNIRWRIVDETKSIPAILIGVNSQGRGEYFKNEKRFQVMSPGFFAVASKSFSWALGDFAIHAGVNYSWEQPSGNYAPNIWLGFDHSIGKPVSISFELNPNFAATKELALVNRILLNAAVRWTIVNNITLEFIFHDLFNHTINRSGFERWIGLEFIHNF